MATYISLVSLTDRGVADFKETVNRAEQAASLMKSLGGEMTHTYWTLGQHDLVVISEFPDDETGTAAALAISSQGNIRTTTLRAFDSDEMRAIISKVS